MAPREHRRRTPRCLQMILKHLRGLRQLEARAFKKAEAPGGVARGFLRIDLGSASLSAAYPLKQARK
jgi:hypothetical protein